METVSLAEGVKRLRGLAGLSQAELADRLDVDASYVSLIESGKREPSLAVLRGIAKALSVPASLLLALAFASDLSEQELSVYGPLLRQMIDLSVAAQLGLELSSK